MKPDWKDAPEWANWLAMDSDGQWSWYGCRPKDGEQYWYAPKGKVLAATNAPEWREKIEQRPEAKP